METKDGQIEGTLSKVLNENAKYLRSKKNKKKELEHDAVFSQLFRYASTSDVILMAVGTIAALANGIMLPFTSFLFGDLTSAFVSQEKYADDPRYINNTYLGAGNIFHTYQDHITSADHNYTRIPHDLITKQVFLYLNHHFGMIYIYIGLSVCALSFIQTACWETACCNQISKLRQIYFTQCLRQDIAWYDERGNEDLTNKITDDMERMRDGLGSKVPVFLQAVSLMFSGLMVGFFTNWRLTLAIMIGGPCLVIASAFTAKVSSGVAAREQLRYGIAGGVASEALSSIRTICAYGGEKWELGRFSEAVAEGRKLTMSKYYSLAAGMALSIGLIYVLYGVGLWYGTELFLEDLLVPGQLFTVFMSVITGALSIGNSLPNVIEISTAIGSAAVVLDIIDSLPKIDPYSEEGLTIRDMKGEIRFSNVYFSYPTRPQVMVLSGLDLTIATGKVVAIVGASGGGKSTLVNLILRFYDPLCGKVLIDGNNVADLNVRSLRDSIGVVSQEPTLFDVSIRENIRYGRPEATTQEIEEAAKVACAHTFIESLPKGYDTLVGERGLQLSGGQKQRLAIARALVRRPKILLLDEATSALDSQSESVVQAALDNASKGRTTVIIAHRLSTIRNADIIYALKDGRIAECGQHSELMEKKGIYYNLVLAQSKKSIELEEPEKKQIDVITPVEKVEPKKSLRRSLMRMSMRALGIDSADFSFQELEGLNYLQLLQLTDSPWMIFTTVAACVIAGCHMPTFSLLYGGMLGLFVLPEDEFKREVITWCILFGVLAFITAGSIATAVLASSAVTENMIKELRVKTFKNILSQQVSFFDQESHSPIKLTNILAKEPPLVKNIAGMRAGYILLTVVTTTLSVAIAFYCGWRIALIVLCFVPFIIFGNWIQMSLKFKSYIQECKTTERIAKIASESLQNIKTVQFLCLQDHMLQMFSEELKSCHGDEKKQSFVFSTTFAIVQATTYIMYGCTFNFGSDFVDEGYMTGEDIYRTVFALVIASTNLGATALFFQDFGKAKVAITNVVKLMTTRSTMPNLEEGEKPEIRGSVEFKDIIFSYPSRKHIPVLAGLSLEIPEGKTVALVGGSGCGKSTIIGLLERFYSPRKGQILVDGMNIDKISTSHLRGQIGLVTQEPTLFDCSLRENISYGISSLGRKVTDQEIIDAAKAANIHEFIASLPEGYETKVGERGSKLSGGQKQRVAIARALLRKPKILLLDEATSALDTESEKIEDDQMPSALRAVITQVQHSDEGYIPATTGGLFSLFEHLGIQAHLLCPGHVHGHSMVVQDALDNARQGRTSIVIAHRLSTVQSADLIAVISEGKVAELGTHNQLLELQGLYYDLVRCQYERN